MLRMVFTTLETLVMTIIIFDQIIEGNLTGLDGIYNQDKINLEDVIIKKLKIYDMSNDEMTSYVYMYVCSQFECKLGKIGIVHSEFGGFVL